LTVTLPTDRSPVAFTSSDARAGISSALSMLAL
jgi:hypothetical protein